MNCPRCSEPLAAQRSGDVEIDGCATCRGLFLDRGELNKVAAPTSGDLEFSTVHGDSFQHDDGFGPIACPRCGDAEMKKVEFNIYTGVILDYCERCQGFWLDGNELERINDEVRKLNEADDRPADPPMLWFARFIWGLPR